MIFQGKACHTSSYIFLNFAAKISVCINRPIIEVIEEAYYIDAFDTTRKISALLPHDYHNSDKHYSVLYLQDGQNLFNPNAPYGDWAIDRSLEKLAEEGFNDLIIIAIDHGHERRISEYFPYKHPKYGEGKGRTYINFMRDKLIPYVNNKYRVKTDYASTGIGGSSMGGLISLFGGLTHPGVFGKLMVFSPSLWISNEVYKDALRFDPLPETRMYFYAGGKESKSHLMNVKRLEKLLTSKIHSEVYFDMELIVNDHGMHSELYWGQEFPKAVKWLFYNKTI